MLSLLYSSKDYEQVLRNNEINIGPESAGYLIKQHAKLWGGSKTTLTDMAQALGHVDFSSIKFTKQETMCAKNVMDEVVVKLEKLYQKISGPRTNSFCYCR